MTEFFNSLHGFEKILWYIAVFTSVVFVIQSVMLLIGGDVDSDVESEFDADIETDATDVDNAQEDVGKSFGWISLKNLINFFLIFSWVGISCLSHGLSTTVTLLISSGSGILFAVVMVVLFKAMKKLSQDGTPKLSSAVGKTCTVYLTVPENGKGKVNVELGGSIKTMDAMSEKGDFKTGTLAKVTKILDGVLIIGE